MNYRKPNTSDNTIQTTHSGKQLERLNRVCAVLNVKIQDFVRNAVDEKLDAIEPTIPELMAHEDLVKKVRELEEQLKAYKSSQIDPVQITLFNDEENGAGETAEEKREDFISVDTSAEDPFTVSLKELAEQTGIAYGRLRDYALEGKIPHLPREKYGPFFFILKDAVEAIRKLTETEEDR